LSTLTTRAPLGSDRSTREGFFSIPFAHGGCTDDHENGTGCTMRWHGHNNDGDGNGGGGYGDDERELHPGSGRAGRTHGGAAPVSAS